MKKIKLSTSKLKLAKERIAMLSTFEMKSIYGGNEPSTTNPPVTGISACHECNTPTPTPPQPSSSCVP